MTRNRRTYYEAAGSSFLEVWTDCLGTAKSSVQICLDDFVPGFDGSFKDTAVCWTTCICDERIDSSKVCQDFGDGFLDGGPFADVAGVGTGSDAEFTAKILCIFYARLWAGEVGYGDGGAEFCAVAGCFDSDALWTRGAGNYYNLSFEAEKVEESFGVCDREMYV